MFAPLRLTGSPSRRRGWRCRATRRPSPLASTAKSVQPCRRLAQGGQHGLSCQLRRSISGPVYDWGKDVFIACGIRNGLATHCWTDLVESDCLFPAEPSVSPSALHYLPLPHVNHPHPHAAPQPNDFQRCSFRTGNAPSGRRLVDRFRRNWWIIPIVQRAFHNRTTPRNGLFHQLLDPGPPRNRSSPDSSGEPIAVSAFQADLPLFISSRPVTNPMSTAKVGRVS